MRHDTRAQSGVPIAGRFRTDDFKCRLLSSHHQINSTVFKLKFILSLCRHVMRRTSDVRWALDWPPMAAVEQVLGNRRRGFHETNTLHATNSYDEVTDKYSLKLSIESPCLYFYLHVLFPSVRMQRSSNGTWQSWDSMGSRLMLKWSTFDLRFEGPATPKSYSTKGSNGHDA